MEEKQDEYFHGKSDYEEGKYNAYDEVVQIVNQLAEEYKHCIKSSCSNCEVYDTEKHYCPKWCDVIKGTVAEIEENHNGWIPCSERLPEEKENPITHDYMQYPVMVNIGGTLDLRYYYFGNGHWRLGFQIMDEYVTHWMDIAPYQPKGE